jgi:hypothetical protein
MAKTLNDELKVVCSNYGFGNDGNELKIVTVMGTYLRATIVFRKWRETFTHGACYEPPRVF